MATNLIVKATNICSGGGHATIQVTGDTTFSFDTHFQTIEEALQAQANPDTLAAIIRVARITRTAAQVKSVLTSAQGLAVTI